MTAVRYIALDGGKVIVAADLQLAMYKRDGGHAEPVEIGAEGVALLLRHPKRRVRQRVHRGACAARGAAAQAGAVVAVPRGDEVGAGDHGGAQGDRLRADCRGLRQRD